MDEQTRMEARRATQRRRRPPGDSRRVRLTFDSAGKLCEEIVPEPTDLIIEATNAEGELADWLDDSWWTEVIERWGDDPITLHIAPTPGALLHLVVFHQLEMIRRITPIWRLVGHAYHGDLADDEAIKQLVRGPYDEVRVIDALRPGRAPAERYDPDISLGQLFGRIRRVQADTGTAKPILVRVPATAWPSALKTLPAILTSIPQA